MEHIQIPPHVQRLREEHEQMEQRLRKLKIFIDESPIFTALDAEEQEDMKAQATHMSDLETILSRRLARALAKV